MVLILFFVVLLSCPPSWLHPGSPSPGVVGQWITEEGKARVEIFQCDTTLCGRIVWARQQTETSDTLLDIHNPDAALRDRPIIGLVILKSFAAEGNDRWTGGSVYDPESGSTYNATLELVDTNTLDLRGYILIPLFGRTTTWTRVEQD
ncbi:MAG: DUF2147 domain-containing protein [Ignavibacteria bacterium]|nr:DUF2147 domain-containing protein [Ignavibacteria bacterium]